MSDTTYDATEELRSLDGAIKEAKREDAARMFMVGASVIYSIGFVMGGLVCGVIGFLLGRW